MRKSVLVLVVVMALAFSALPALAQVPTPNGPFTSAFTIQNLTGTPASCVFTFYNESGGTVYTSSSLSISANGSYFVYVGNIAGLSSGQYSGVISCDQPVAAVANTTGPASAAAYMGSASSSAAQTLFAPGLYKNYVGYYSNVVVQNTTAAPINASLAVFSGATQVFSVTKSIPANASVAFDQNNATDFAGLPAGLYSGKIIATGAAVGVVNIWNAQGQYFQYVPVASGGAQAYTPVLMNNYYGFNTALTVQNLDTVSTAPVTVTYSNGHQSTFTIPASGSHLFYTPNDGIPSGFLGSAKIQSGGGSIVALVNQSSNTNRADSYIGFVQGSNSANAPIVLKTYYGYSTSITCQNVGGSPTTIKVTYSNATFDQVANVASNGSALFYQPNSVGLPANFNGSAVISSSPAQPIVCVVNQNQVSNPASQDWLLAYTPIGQ
jgi:hypothetical protein